MDNESIRKKQMNQCLIAKLYILERGMRSFQRQWFIRSSDAVELTKKLVWCETLHLCLGSVIADT